MTRLVGLSVVALLPFLLGPDIVGGPVRIPLAGDGAPVDNAADSMPGPWTLNHRLLSYSLVLIGRCTKLEREDDGPRDALEGDDYSLKIVEVLRGGQDLDEARKGALILNNDNSTGTVLGVRHPIPTDVDVLIFCGFGIYGKLGLLGGCTNAVVPLRGLVTEIPGPKFEFEKMEAAEFVKLVRKRIPNFTDFDYLLSAFRSASGSRHPYSVADRPKLLERILLLEDKRVPELSLELHELRLWDSESEVLRNYFIRTGTVAPLRQTFEDLLVTYVDGELGGREDYRARGRLVTGRLKSERLMDAGRALADAGDTDYLADRLMPLYRGGNVEVGTLLILAGVEVVLSDMVRRIEQNGLEEETVRVLARSRERSALLAAIRLTFAQEDPQQARRFLEQIREEGRFDVFIRDAEDRTIVEIQKIWQERWSSYAHIFESTLPDGTVDLLLGTDPDWVHR